MSLALIAEKKRFAKNKSIVTTFMWIFRIYIAAFAVVIAVTSHSKKPQSVAKATITKH
jgi:hypothetical protein